MYNRLKKLYNDDRLSDQMLQVACNKGWITNKQKAQIIKAKTTHK